MNAKTIKKYVVAFIVTTAPIALCPSCAPAAEAQPAQEQIQWVRTYAEALAQAKEKNKPIFIDFEAQWCSWCKTMDRETFADERTIEALSGYICAKIDVDREERTAFAFKIRSLPRAIFINKHGEIVGDAIGYREPDDFLALIEDLSEYLEKKTGGKLAPEMTGGSKGDTVVELLALPENDKIAALVGRLGDPDPAIRQEASEALAAASPAPRAALAAALESRYLGARIGALKTLKKIAPDPPPFDPWAPKAERAEALGAWREWLDRGFPAKAK